MKLRINTEKLKKVIRDYLWVYFVNEEEMGEDEATDKSLFLADLLITGINKFQVKNEKSQADTI